MIGGDETGWIVTEKGRTVEEADVDAGVSDASGQGPPDLGVGVRGIHEISRERGGPVSAHAGDTWIDGRTNIMGISSNAASVRYLANIGGHSDWESSSAPICTQIIPISHGWMDGPSEISCPRNPTVWYYFPYGW